MEVWSSSNSRPSIPSSSDSLAGSCNLSSTICTIFLTISFIGSSMLIKPTFDISILSFIWRRTWISFGVKLLSPVFSVYSFSIIWWLGKCYVLYYYIVAILSISLFSRAYFGDISLFPISATFYFGIDLLIDIFSIRPFSMRESHFEVNYFSCGVGSMILFHRLMSLVPTLSI